MENSFDVAIIGGGLGGLQCGYILSKKGLNVCILEKNPLLGGCLQSYRRKGADGLVQEFDSGMHYVGGLDQGQALHTLLGYFNLLNLPWKKMDTEGFDEVNINGKSYLYANGYNNFVERMAEYFPTQKEGLKKYVALLKQVGDSLPNAFSPRAAEDTYTQSLFARPAKEFLWETISDPLLREVLSGTSLKMELSENLPLYTFAQINSSFIQSAYRLQGGGNLISDSLAESIKGMGGTICTKSEVTQICGEEITINSQDKIRAKYIISSVHPTATINLVGEEGGLRKVYRNRINRLENTFGMFTANIALKPGHIPYLNRNRYIYKLGTGESLWDNNGERLLMSYYTPASGDSTLALDLLTPMYWDEVKEWENTTVGHRDAAYEVFKQEKLKGCLKLASEVIPQLEGAIERVYTSTPLTYRDYTATVNGTAYGIRKDCNNLMLTLLTPRTPLENLLLTGQSLNLHGVLGVSMTSFFTCANIIGMESAVEGLKF